MEHVFNGLDTDLFNFYNRQLSNYGEQNLRCLVAVLRFTMEATINQVS
jgi:hypothetical protein